MVFSLSENFGFKRAASSAPVPTNTLQSTGIASAVSRGKFMIPSAAEDFSRFDMTYYLKGAAAGGICCGVTHGALTPVDVVRLVCSPPWNLVVS